MWETPQRKSPRDSSFLRPAAATRGKMINYCSETPRRAKRCHRRHAQPRSAGRQAASQLPQSPAHLRPVTWTRHTGGLARSLASFQNVNIYRSKNTVPTSAVLQATEPWSPTDKQTLSSHTRHWLCVQQTATNYRCRHLGHSDAAPGSAVQLGLAAPIHRAPAQPQCCHSHFPRCTLDTFIRLRRPGLGSACTPPRPELVNSCQ